MTAKQFFKSASFKCIATLMGILLICGIFLSIAYAFLEVSAEERLQRAISKIYGYTVETEAVDITNSEIGKSIIEEAYYVKDDGNYLIKSTGKEGYDSGTVTCWIIVEVDGGKVTGIGKVTIESNVGQSFISRVTDAALDQFVEFYTDDIIYTPDLITGATVTYTKTALCNAVNGAINFVKTEVLGEETAADPFEGFMFTEYIETALSSYSVDGTQVTYKVVTSGYEYASTFRLTIVVGEGATIVSFAIDENGNGSTEDFDEEMDASVLNGSYFNGKTLDDLTAVLGDDLSFPSSAPDIFAGASYSSYLCMYAAGFAVANYDACIAGGNS